LACPKTRRQALQAQLRKPQELLLRRVADVMQRLKIEPIAQLGVAFDASIMRAIGSTSSGASSGSVTEICRQGHRLAGDVLQLAEVRVEK
jgi:molecular chaperone GrpE (heat shock protein)